jgi:Domain of unknown function (DUF4124)
VIGMGRFKAASVCAGTALLLAARVASAGPLIYSCVDGNGKRLTSDRPIAACSDREQRVLNPDGSVKEIVPPTMTTEERNAKELRERELVAERTNKADTIRRDRTLAMRFPNETTHQAAREAALNDVRKAVKASEARMALLATERKPLLDESEFYLGKALPPKLKQLLDANDAATEAQRTLIQNQQEEIVRISARYDVELERLKRLWSGALPGSMGGMPVTTVTAAPRAASTPNKTAAN